MNPFRTIRRAPVTVGLIWLACLVFVGVYLETVDPSRSWRESQSLWGAGLNQELYFAESSGSDFEKVDGFLGPIKVWEGEWWRLLVNHLHHGGLLHLLLNGCAMIYLGRIIERRMSSPAYLTLLIGSAFCVAAVEGLVGEVGVGLSGIAYAQVGLLLVWRDRDESVAEEFTMRAVLLFGFWLLFCQVITYAEIYPVGNAAHYTGLIYGWIWGQAYLEQRQKGIFRFVFGVSHLLLYPAFWFIIHPFWSGSWHLYLSQEQELNRRELQAQADEKQSTDRRSNVIEHSTLSLDDDDLRRKAERLQTAVLMEPSLEFGWVQLSDIYESTGDRRLALRTALEGLKQNRGSQRLLNRAVDLWVDDERFSKDSNVPVLVQQVFGEEAGIWEEKLAARVQRQRNRYAWKREELAQLIGAPHFRARFPLGIPPALLIDRIDGPRGNFRDYVNSQLRSIRERNPPVPDGVIDESVD